MKLLVIGSGTPEPTRTTTEGMTRDPTFALRHNRILVPPLFRHYGQPH